MTYGNYPNLENINKILVIKLRQIGDVLLTTPVFSVLKEKFPKAKIDAYIYGDSKDILDENPNIDELIVYDRKWKKLSFFKKILKEFILLKYISKQKYDLVINLTEGDRGAIAARFSKAAIKVGFDPKKTGLFGKKDLYSHIVKSCSNKRHNVERNLDAIRKIGIFPKYENRNLFLNISEQTKNQVEKLLKENNFSNKFILVHPSSRWRFKCYSNDKMKRVLSTLIDQGHNVVITSGRDEAEKNLVEKIIKNLEKSKILNLSGQISLKHLACLIKMSKCTLCVDSAPFHMANALMANVVCLFGPTCDENWGIWKNNNAHIISENISCRPCHMDGCGGSKYADCMALISEKRVIETVLNTIA
jgi:heptosyltransferase III